MSIAAQVVILFLVVLVGVLCRRLGYFTDETIRGVTQLVVNVTLPVLTVYNMQRPFDMHVLMNFLLTLLLSLAAILASIGGASLLFRHRPHDKRAVLLNMAGFSNCGFMAVPLQTAILGSLGVFYGSAYLLVFTVLTWTLGIQLVKGGKMAFSWRTLLLNPGVIGVAIAMVLYLLQITLPEIILSPLTYLSDMNTPLPMVVIGYQLSQADFRRALHGASFWVSAALRLVILPLLALGVCMLMRLDSGVTLAVVIAASTPPAALLGMFAAKFDKDVSLAPSLVAVQTLLSMITMPLVLGLAKFLV